MAQMEAERFACEACGKSYRWRAELAGKKVKCACGHVMVAPEPEPVPAAAEEEDLYALAGEEKIKPKPKFKLPLGYGNCPACGAHLVEGAMLCVQCGHHLLGDRGPKSQPVAAVAAPPIAPPPAMPPVVKPLAYAHGAAAGESVADQYFPDKTKDLHLPLALILVGTVVEVGMGMFYREGTVPKMLAGVGIGMAVNTALMLIAVFAVAKMRGIKFGPLPTAILKLSGISIGPGAIGGLIGFGLGWLPLFGGLIGLVAGFCLYFASIGALFDLDESDTWWLVITIFVVELLATFAIAGLMLRTAV